MAGSKTARQPEHLRTDEAKAMARCVAGREEQVHARLAATPGGVDLTPAMTRELAARRNVFMKRDSHWEGNAQLIFVRAMLEAAQPGLAKEVGLKQVDEPISGQADLTKMIGMPVIKRDRLPPIASRPKQYPDARPAETLLIGDSQMRLAMTDQLEDRPPISEAALPGPFYCERSRFSTGVCDEQLAGARTVLLEWVARDMQDLTTACVHFTSTLLPDLRKRLTAQPAKLVGAADDQPLARRLRLGSQPTRVRFAPTGGGVADSLRLLVVPVERLGTPQPGGPEAVTVVQKPTDGGTIIPCGSAAAGAGGAVILPMPAGRDAAKTALELTAPPGTVLGKPEVLVLDDAAVERGMQDALKR